MKTFLKITITSLFGILLLSSGNVQAMTFDEYKQILAEKNITLDPEQEILFGAFFSQSKPTTKKEITTDIEKVSKKQIAFKDFSDFSYILKNGVTDLDTNGMVSKLQRILQKDGFNIGAIDGYYGPQTINAIEILKEKDNIKNSPLGIFNPRDFSDTDTTKPMHLFLATDEIFFYQLPVSNFTANTDIICNGQKIEGITKDDSIIFPLAFPYYKETPFTCALENEKQINTFLTVHKKENKKETSYATITVSEIYSTPNTANDKRVAQEKEMLSTLYEKHADDPAYFNEAFGLPINSELISPYGKTRIMNGVVSSFHTGTDWRSRTPESIHATNDGIVMFTGNLFYCGNTVIINHGLDIFTIYCHMSQTDVNTNDVIEKGQTLGKTGATGRVSGAHLHVSSKFENKYMDFMRIYQNSQILEK